MNFAHFCKKGCYFLHFYQDIYFLGAKNRKIRTFGHNSTRILKTRICPNSNFFDSIHLYFCVSALAWAGCGWLFFLFLFTFAALAKCAFQRGHLLLTVQSNAQWASLPRAQESCTSTDANTVCYRCCGLLLLLLLTCYCFYSCCCC